LQLSLSIDKPDYQSCIRQMIPLMQGKGPVNPSVFKVSIRRCEYSLTPHEGIADKDAAQGLAEAQTVIGPVDELDNELDCEVLVGVVELLDEELEALELLELLEVEVLVCDGDDVEVGDVGVTELPGETEDVDVVVLAVVVLVTVDDVEDAAAVMHEHTAPAEFLAARAVAIPQALVAHPSASITIL
jgi:hypothetical protein